MLQSNIYDITNTDPKKEHGRDKSKPIYIRSVTHSVAPGSLPNSPPTNTPPNISVIRELYLNYLSAFKK